jgi:hypothetical protein
VVMPHILLDYLACGGGNNYVAELTTFVPHFNVWKDDALLETTENTSWLDDDVVDGETYCYTVSEVVRPGVETGMSNQECVVFVYDEVPVNRFVTGVAGSGEINCLDAQQTITVQNFTAESGSSTNLIAGHSIVFLPETHIKSGASLHAWITGSGEFCAQQPSMLASEAVPDDTPDRFEMKEFSETGFPKKPHFIIYPNPTTGIFTIEWLHPGNLTDVSVEIFNMQGNVTYRFNAFEASPLIIDLSAQPRGIYFVRVVMDEKIEVVKLIKH